MWHRIGRSLLLMVSLILPTKTGFADRTRQIGVNRARNFVKIATGFAFAEGPAFDTHGNLYFTDQRDGPGRIFRLDTLGRLTLFRSNANRANGLAINQLGEIVACEMQTGRVVAYEPNGRCMRFLANGYCGRRFNAPNDLAIDRHAGIYFTDPRFHSPSLLLPQKCTAVYYIAPSGRVTRLITDLRNPNGIVLSPDETTLYVIPSMQREVMAYPILSPGCLGGGRVFCRLAFSRIPIYRGGDGAAMDARGNLYVCTQRGVRIYDACGKRLGILRVPEQPSNVTLGPDGETLIITARTSIYMTRWTLLGR